MTDGSEAQAGLLGLPPTENALLDAVAAIGSDLDLHSVLMRLVESACVLTSARYGALGVLGSGGDLSDFITHGLTDEERERIGPLPRGRGILGRVIEHPEPLRLHRLADHPESYGFPANHPPMETFLGVPVRIRGTVFGNLYLTEKHGGLDFTQRDEALVTALAAAAGFVIENARVYAQSELRRQWLEALAQIAESLQPPLRQEAAFQQIVSHARRVSGAESVVVVGHGSPEEPVSMVAMSAELGVEPESIQVLIDRYAEEIVSSKARFDVVVRPLDDGGSFVLVPIRSHLTDQGVLVAVFGASHGRPQPEELGLLGSFTDQVSLALDRAQALAERSALAVLEDRDRIARDLHDLVIQRLFATGLQLQGAARRTEDGDVRDRVDRAVADLDVTIKDIRSTIFELHHRGDESGVKSDVQALVREYAETLGFMPAVRIEGPVDTAVPDEVRPQLLAVLREGLSNVARHAQATEAVVDLSCGGGEVALAVSDNGVGPPADQTRESGIRNARARAAELGGDVVLRRRLPHGTVLDWRVPLAP